MLTITPTNWQEVQKTLAIELKPIACRGEYNRLVSATDFNTFFEVLFTNYGWLKENNYTIAELEAITPIQYSGFIVWLLSTYCLGRDADTVVLPVIDVHKSRLAGNEPTTAQWTAAWYAASAAWYAASDAASDAAWDAAAWAAAMAAAWDAAMAAGWVAARATARENIANKLISIIY